MRSIFDIYMPTTTGYMPISGALSLNDSGALVVIAADPKDPKKTVEQRINPRNLSLDRADPDDKWWAVRAKRNALLAATDFTQAGDVPITTSERTKWKTYRTTLRDITTQADPSSVVWPEPPT